MSNEVRNLVKSRAIGEARLKGRKVTSPLRKALLLAMADRADDSGRKIFSSMPTFADETGFSLNALRNASDTLQAEGLIRHLGQRRDSQTINYEIDVSKVAALPFTRSATRKEAKKGMAEPHHPVCAPTPPSGGVPPHPVGTRHPLRHPEDIRDAEKGKSPLCNEEGADVPDHLAGNDDFAKFVADQQARGHG